MTPNSQEIVQQIRDKFEEIITFITQNQQESPSIYQTEKYLLTSLLSLGQNLLLAFIMTQQEKLENTDSVCLNGDKLPIHSLKRRSYRSIFGKLNFKRAYYYKAGQSYFLLDAKLKMPENSLSDLLREWLSELACYMPYHKAGKAFESILTQKFSCRSLEEVILEDSTLVEEFYQNNCTNSCTDSSFISSATEAAILVAQADGKGIPMLPEKLQPIRVRLGKGEKLGQKKEAIVTSVYTIAPFVRTPEEVTISLFKENKNQENEKLKKSKKRVGPQNKQLWATLEGKKLALEFTSKQVALREGAHISMRVALTDGSAPLQEKMQTHLPHFSLVLDIIHAVEYLWEAGNSLHGEKSPLRQVCPWSKSKTRFCTQT